MITVASLVEYLEQLAPPELAAGWDNAGLLLGDRAAAVQRAMTCLTITPEVAQEAIESKAQLIVTHHPILFKPVQRLTAETAEGRMVLSLAQAGVAVYSPHTAFDSALGGINDLLAKKLELTEVVPLRRRNGGPEYKLVVFVPDKDLARVSDALFSAGAGQIGQYSQCSFRLAGTGSFFGSESSQPTIGQKGRREEVSEWRLEVICPEARLSEAVAAMRAAHSYEEPAFDIYRLQSVSAPSPLFPLSREERGEGRLGRLPEPTSLATLARKVKAGLSAGLVQTVGNLNDNVTRVAIACGAGHEFLRDAIQAKAEVFLTGEVHFHDFLAAQAHGLSLLLPGHYATEHFGIEELAARIKERWSELQVWASEKETDPLRWI
jgi:dinuclear metal center YbgI/SA1388 family protein